MPPSITNLTRYPFTVSVGNSPVELFVNPTTKNILYGQASLGFSFTDNARFAVQPGDQNVLVLSYKGVAFAIGQSPDQGALLAWADAANRFLSLPPLAVPVAP